LIKVVHLFVFLFVCFVVIVCWGEQKKMIPGRVYLPVCYDDERFRYCANGDGNDPVYFIFIFYFLYFIALAVGQQIGVPIHPSAR